MKNVKFEHFQQYRFIHQVYQTISKPIQGNDILLRVQFCSSRKLLNAKDLYFLVALMEVFISFAPK
jgi:hypothetical protein